MIPAFLFAILYDITNPPTKKDIIEIIM